VQQLLFSPLLILYPTLNCRRIFHHDGVDTFVHNERKKSMG
jgi:hypothetical protein